MLSAVQIVLICAISAILSASLILLLLPTLRRITLAHPNSRSSHRTPTPQGGGIAVIGATLLVAGSAALASWFQLTLGSASFTMVMASAAFIAAVGMADDIRSIAIVPRLLLQALAAALVVSSLPDDLQVFPTLPWWIERIAMTVALLWFVNLTNFMDGLDWMTVAETVPVTAGIAVLGLLIGLPAEVVTVALVLCAATLGFAPFNKPVAQLFMGDVGSLAIGLLIGWMLLLLAAQGHLAAAILLPLYYLTDATLTLLLRAFRGEPFWQAHRSHFYQRATDVGFGVLTIVGQVFAVNMLLAALAAITILFPGPETAWSCLAIGGILVAFLLWRFTIPRTS